MSSLKVISHYPTINSSGFFRNDTIKIYFDKPIEPSTIKWDTFSLNDNYSFGTCVGTLSPIWASGINLSGVTSGLAFTPTITLLPNTEYSVYVYAAPNSIIAKDGSELQETYSYNFITGTGYYTNIEGGIVGVPSGVSETSSGNILAGGFYIESTTPSNGSYDVATNLGQIDIVFNADIYTDLSTLSGYVDVQIEDVLNK